jgi:ferritin-like metal-binding protein YciE
MFERFEKPAEAYEFKLGAALTMEKKIVEMLEENIAAAQDAKVKDLLRTHQQETKNHVEVLEQVFGAFEWDIDDSPCPAIDGLEKEGKATVKKTDDSFVDSVILQGAVEVEHHEIGVYTNLILNARAMGRQDVVDLLEKNLHSEENALQKVIAQQEQVAAVSPKPQSTRS